MSEKKKTNKIRFQQSNRVRWDKYLLFLNALFYHNSQNQDQEYLLVGIYECYSQERYFVVARRIFYTKPRMLIDIKSVTQLCSYIKLSKFMMITECVNVSDAVTLRINLKGPVGKREDLVALLCHKA